jgi:hypothetical protein
VTPGLRARLPYVALAIGTIALGLTVHWRGHALPPDLRDILGDASWATMIAWWVGAAAPRAALWRRGLVALAVCVVVELSQTYRAPWLDAVRATSPGHLVLGSDFASRDIVAYAFGVLAAVLLEGAVRGRWMSRI